MRNVARGVLALLGAGILFGLYLIRVHASYPWYEAGHLHWLPLLWVFILYGGLFFVGMALVAGVFMGLLYLIHRAEL